MKPKYSNQFVQNGSSPTININTEIQGYIQLTSFNNLNNFIERSIYLPRSYLKPISIILC